jgi:hypothetical protein
MVEYKIQRLTSQEIQELKFDQVLRIIALNTNTLSDIEDELFNSIGEAGKWAIKVTQLKSLKSSLIEQQRALKSIVQNG